MMEMGSAAGAFALIVTILPSSFTMYLPAHIWQEILFNWANSKKS